MSKVKFVPYVGQRVKIIAGVNSDCVGTITSVNEPENEASIKLKSGMVTTKHLFNIEPVEENKAAEFVPKAGQRVRSVAKSRQGSIGTVKYVIGANKSAQVMFDGDAVYTIKDWKCLVPAEEAKPEPKKETKVADKFKYNQRVEVIELGHHHYGRVGKVLMGTPDRDGEILVMLDPEGDYYFTEDQLTLVTEKPKTSVKEVIPKPKTAAETTTKTTKKETTEMANNGGIMEKGKNAIKATAGAQKQMLVQAATLEAGEILRDQLMKQIVPKLPMVLRGYASTPLGAVVVMNIVGVGIRTAMPQFQPNHPILKISDASVVVSYQEAVKTLNIAGIIEELFSKGPLKTALETLKAHEEVQA